jgi:two-component system phosphate regulon sensor histidine kinase PhoR
MINFFRFLSGKEKTRIALLENNLRELIAKEKESQSEIKRQEAILNSMFDGFFALDSKLNITLVNPRLCSLFGFDKGKDPKGMSLLEFSRSPELEEAAQTVLASGEPLEQTLRRYTAGKRQHFRVFAAPLEGFGGEDDGVVIVLEDISRLVKLERVRKDFASNVSHELRTPIQLVKGYSETLLDSPLDNKEEIRRFVEIIAKSANTMENITGDLLTLVSLEDETSPRLPMEETDLNPLIKEAVGMVEPFAKKKKIRLDLDCSKKITAMLYGPFIIQALINLLNNAITYSSGGSTVTIRAFTKKNAAGEKELLIEVKDQGIGIPADHLDRIFERFYRVDKARSREAGGTGLGLAIVRHIALFHGGKAEVESHAGEGSLFRLRFPLNSV